MVPSVLLRAGHLYSSSRGPGTLPLGLPEDIDGLGRRCLFGHLHTVLVIKILLVDVDGIVLFDAVFHDLWRHPEILGVKRALF